MWWESTNENINNYVDLLKLNLSNLPKQSSSNCSTDVSNFCFILKAKWNTFGETQTRLSCSAESATEAIFLALHNVPRVFHLALKRFSGDWEFKITLRH